MHYYQFNIGDYRKDTAHLTPIEHYIYRTLIDWYYLDEKPIPKETQSVIRRLGLGCEMEPTLTNVLKDFFFETENGWEHSRINLEITHYHGKAKINQINGSKGGRPKKTQSVTNGLPEKPNCNPNQEPITNNQEPIKKPMSEYSDEFLSFWQSYPKKTGKGEAFKSWKKQRPPITDVLKALEWQRTSQDWIKESGQYVPNPATYLNQRRWEDEPKGRVKMTTEEFMRSQL